ncbi:MAG: T9SS type A sorting domain-containing protein [Rhodothermales bacterium]
MKYAALLSALLFLPALSVHTGHHTSTDQETQAVSGPYDNFIVFNRGLSLNEVINQVTVSSGSSVWMIDPSDPQNTLTRVTPEENAGSLMPSWGPDKSQIVFASNRLNAGTPAFLDLWLINTDGSNLRRLTQDAHHNWTPAWSPDGTMIAFASTRNASDDIHAVWRFDIFVMNADGSNPRFLADTGSQDEDPVFSADGRTVYFVAEQEACYQLWQVPTSGGEAGPLLDNANNAVCGEDPSLSPDGQQLFFWSNLTGQFATFDFSTRSISYHSYDAFEPWIGPSGTHFTFMSDGNIFTSDLEGNNVVQITSGGNDFFPRWADPLQENIPTALEAGEKRPALALLPNYPNPFRGETTIRYVLATPDHVTARVYDVLGREVATLTDGYRQAGEHRLRFEAHALKPGVYWYRLETSRTTLSRSFMVLK